MKKQYKKYLYMLIATQLMICTVVVTILFYSFKSVSFHHNNILQSIAIKDTEECMREMVNNTIIRIESKRKTTLEETNKLIDGIAQVLLDCQENAINKEIQTISNNLYQMEYGAPIQILIRSKKNQAARLFSKGKVVKVSSDKGIKEVLEIAKSSQLHRSIAVGAFDIDLFAEETDMDEVAKNHIYQEIHNANYAENEYIWVNEVLDFAGGDQYAIRRIHPNLKDTEGSYLSTNKQDIKGNLPYLKELNGIKEKGEVLQTYYFKNKVNNEITQKISYAKLYKPFNWIIATGKPLNDIFLYTDEMQEKNTQLIHNTMLLCFFFMLMIFSLGISFIVIVHRNYRKKLDTYVKTETELDPLTGAFNRKVGESLLANYVLEPSQRHHTTLPLLMMIDIDNFKKVNDSYGHEIGDIVLKKVVESILAHKKDSDCLFRWGGEEFILLINEAEKSHHQMYGKRVLRSISEIEFENNEERFRVSVSIGSSFYHKEDIHYSEVIKRADVALYHSKNTGKNKYTNFEELSLEKFE